MYYSRPVLEVPPSTRRIWKRHRSEAKPQSVGEPSPDVSTHAVVDVPVIAARADPML